MSEEKKITGEQEVTETKTEETAVQEAQPMDPPNLVRFGSIYDFEGKKISQVDLSGLETLTAQDMVDAEAWLTKKGIVSALPEMAYEYVSFIAARASSQPIELFKKLKPKDAMKVKQLVNSFFYAKE